MSVALCTYNGATYLPAQLGSILGGTQMPDELVICDDRSTDATASIVKEFQERAPFPVRFSANPGTLGPAQNFARCLGLCTGEVIFLSDQDDLWEPGRVEQTRVAFARNPAVTFTYADAPLIDGEGQPLGRTLYSSLPIRPEDRQRLEHGGDLLPVLTRYSVLCGATMAVRATVRASALPVPVGWMHDEWIGLVGNCLGPAHRMPEPVMRYRQHEAQQLGTGNWTWGTHLRVARERQGAFYRRETERLRAALAAVEARPELQARLGPLLQARLDFAQSRWLIQTGGLRQLPLLGRVLFSGQYSRYASGLRSAAKDGVVMLRGNGRGEPKADARA